MTELSVIRCTSFRSKLLGLMFTRRQYRALVLEFPSDRLVPLHMFFVFYPIDVAWLDAAGRIVEMKRDFRPFTLCFPRKRARFVAELPAGYLRSRGLEAGDALDISIDL